MADLTDAQQVILSAAARHADGVLLPAPKACAKDAANLARALKSLVKRGLAAEQPTKTTGAAVWRSDKAGQRYTLAVTEAGRAAILGDDHRAAPVPKKAGPTRGKSGRSAAGAKPGTKLGLLTDLLRRKTGATVEEAMKATGWQAHSVRGAISGALKTKRGLAVAAETVEGRGRVYRIAR